MDPYSGGSFDHHLHHYHRMMLFQPYARINPFPTSSSASPHSPSSPSGLSSSSSASAGHGFRPMKTKICGVCGDRAKSYHFGGISCDSCKAFFRRSVQNDAYKNFHCPYEGQCDINISSRKCCQFCRFKKCLSIGMEKSWVMTEEERLQMLKSRLEKRQKQESQEHPSPSASSSSTSCLNPGASCSSSATSDQQQHPSSTGVNTSPSNGLSPTNNCSFRSSSSSFSTSRSSFNCSSSYFRRLRAQYEPDVNRINLYLSDHDVKTIETLMNQYLMSCQEIPLKLDSDHHPHHQVDHDANPLSQPITPEEHEDHHHRHNHRDHHHHHLHQNRLSHDDPEHVNLGSAASGHESNRCCPRVPSIPPESLSESASSLSASTSSCSSRIPGVGANSISLSIRSKNDDDDDDDDHNLTSPNPNPHCTSFPPFTCSNISLQKSSSSSSGMIPSMLIGGPHLTPSSSSGVGVGIIRRSRASILEIFFTCIQQFSSFSQRLGVFSRISPCDQEKLLRASVLEMCLIMSGYCYDVANDCWPDVTLPRFTSHRMILSASDLKQVMSQELFDKHMSITRSIREMNLDEVSLMILCVIILLSPDRSGLLNPLIISKEQESYLILLQNYMSWKFSDHISSILYPKLLLKLPDLRELADVLTDLQLNLCRQEMEEVHIRLKSLNLISPSASMASSPTSSSSSSSSYSSSSGESLSSAAATASSFLSSSSSSPSSLVSWIFKKDAVIPTRFSSSSSPSSSSIQTFSGNHNRIQQDNKTCSVSSAGEDEMSTSSSTSTEGSGEDERQPSSPD